MPLDFSCKDWEARLRRGEAPIPDLPLNQAMVDEALGIFENLRLPDIEGHPPLSGACGEWFKKIVRAAFGSVDPETRERFLNEIFCLVPKKNSKTTYTAALGLTAMLVNTTPNAKMVVVGPTKEGADTLFGAMKGMIEADPKDPETGENYLENRFHVIDGDQKIVDRLNKTELEVKAFSTSVITGVIPLLVLIDEVHELGSNAKAQKVMRQLKGGMIAKPDALMVMITTQSDGPPAGVFKSELDYARKVRDGEITDTATLPILYEFPEEIQKGEKKLWRDPELWPMVMPNLGKSITVPRLLRDYKKALIQGDDEELSWATQHLNVQAGMGSLSGAWTGAKLWQGAANKVTFEQLMETSDVITAGIDGGGLDDLFGLGLIGRHKKTRVWQSWGRVWAQPEVLAKRPKIASVLRDFEADGDLIICEDATQDLRDVAELLGWVLDERLFPEKEGIGLDPYGVAALIDELAGAGMSGDLLVNVPQGVRLSPAAWGAERKLKDGTLLHSDQPMMDWCVSNAKTERRGNAIMISKAVSGSAKIDPVIALLNAFMLMMRNPVAASHLSSPWDDPNFRLSGR
jgi:phage terminase large subunit-like protein